MGVRVLNYSEVQVNLNNRYSDYHTYEMIRNGNISGICLIDDIVVWTEVVQFPTGINRPAISAYGVGTINYIDWVLVRKYNSPEPIISIGIEQDS